MDRHWQYLPTIAPIRRQSRHLIGTRQNNLVIGANTNPLGLMQVAIQQQALTGIQRPAVEVEGGGKNGPVKYLATLKGLRAL